METNENTNIMYGVGTWERKQVCSSPANVYNRIIHFNKPVKCPLSHISCQYNW